MLGTRTGRLSDAPIPLCLCKTPASTIPPSGSIAGGMAPRPFVASGRSKVQMEVGQAQDVSAGKPPGGSFRPREIVENWALLRDARRGDRMDIHAPRCLNMGGDIIVKERS